MRYREGPDFPCSTPFVLDSVLECQHPIADAAELRGVSQRHARRMPADASEYLKTVRASHD